MFIIFNMPDMEESDIEVNNYEYTKNLYEKYGKTLWKYAFKLSKNNEIADDILSTTFLKVIEKIEIIKKIHSYKIKAYLMSMVKHNYFNFIKRDKLNVDFDSIAEYIPCNADNDFTEKIGVSEVEETLNHIPEPYKSILVYRYVYDEITYEEIAIALNLNVKSIRMYKKRALDMLKNRLKGGDMNND